MAAQSRRGGETTVAALPQPLEHALRALRAVFRWSDDVAPDAQTYRVGAFARRHMFDGFPGERHDATPGWLQIPGTRTFAIGLFVRHDRFVQLALADDRGRVFATGEPRADLQGREPRLVFDADAARGRRDGVRRGTITAFDAGGDVVVGRWTKTRSGYTLGSMRAALPDALRTGLGYRDAVTVAFFAAYLQPRLRGRLIPFGFDDLTWRLSRQAPLSAIRTSVRDEEETRMLGMHVSGLEEYAMRLMRESGALDDVPGLLPDHGAEPMHTLRSPYSGCYFLTWDTSMPFDAALTSLKIEGSLNRMAALRAWLDANAARGDGPTEDAASAAQLALADRTFLENPALVAFDASRDVDPDDADFGVVAGFPALAELTAQALAMQYPDPVHTRPEHDAPLFAEDLHGGVADDADDAHDDGAAGDGRRSAWVVRQTLARLIRSMRLPYRFDCDFRLDPDGGAALEFTAAGLALMPRGVYDAGRGQWTKTDAAWRARMSARYNLRVGIMLAALAFGVDERLDEVAIRIDSLGLEEAIAEQDDVIRSTISDALNAFEHLGDAGREHLGGKSDPKDGDRHGNPTRIMTPPNMPPMGAPRDGRGEEPASGGDDDFDALMRGGGIDEVTFALEDIHGDGHGGDVPPFAATRGADAAADAGVGGDDGAENGAAQNADGADGSMEAGDGEAPSASSGDDAIERLRQGPTMRTLTTVVFTRAMFLERLSRDGLADPVGTYRMFGAALALDDDGGLGPVDPGFSISDARFSPQGAQDAPEEHNRRLDAGAAHVLGADDTFGLAIQRDDLISNALACFHTLAADARMPSALKAQRAMDVIERIGDPELLTHATDVTSALIDGDDTPDFTSTLLRDLDDARLKARDLFFSGQPRQALAGVEQAVAALDDMYRDIDGVPRYFNSYADRVVYNRLFALPDEHTVLIPDTLFYAHLELADALGQIEGPEAALRHLNALVSYAPSYALTHLKLAVQLAQNEDWDSARAACLNALRVSLDRSDAAYAYYRLAQAAWMHDEFDVAYAAYMLSGAIGDDTATRETEMNEVRARALSQCIRLPMTLQEATATLEAHDVPVWPRTEVAPIVLDAARVCVDRAMFVPARTLAVAAMRLVGDDTDAVQLQFLRSLNA